MKRLLSFFLLCALSSCEPVLAQSNIFGCSEDTLVNGPAFSARVAAMPNHFTRIQANWFEINPAPTQFNFTNAPSCNDAIISTAAAQGRAILFDVWGWPAWVRTNDWSNRYADLSAYVTAVLQRWPQIQILGAWNEPSEDQSSNNVLDVGGSYTNNPAALMAQYHQLVTAIYNAKQSVNPAVKIDIGKFANFQSYPPHFQLLKANGTWAMADYLTWHDANDAVVDPLLDNPQTAQYSAIPSVAHQVAWAQNLFPGKQVGCDEHYSYNFTRCIQSATAYRAAGAAMLIEQYIPYPVPANAGTISPIYGTDTNGNLTSRSQFFIEILTMPPDALSALWQDLENP